MATMTWADEVGREQRARRKSLGGETLVHPSKIPSARSYLMGKGAFPPNAHTKPSSVEWDNLVLVVRYEVTPVASWWRAVSAATTDDAAQQAFSLLRSELIRLRQRNDFQAISALLELLARYGSTVHPMLLVAGLRLTYLYRSDVLYWEPARDEIASKLSSRGFNPSEVLIGLLK